MKPLHEIKRDIVHVCRKIDERAYVGGRDGNVRGQREDGGVGTDDVGRALAVRAGHGGLLAGGPRAERRGGSGSSFRRFARPRHRNRGACGVAGVAMSRS